MLTEAGPQNPCGKPLADFLVPRQSKGHGRLSNTRQPIQRQQWLAFQQPSTEVLQTGFTANKSAARRKYEWKQRIFNRRKEEASFCFVIPGLLVLCRTRSIRK